MYFKKEFVSKLETIAYKYGNRSVVFSDAVAMMAYALHNKVNFDRAKEDAYIETVSRYPEHASLFGHMFAITGLALHAEVHDFLGQVFHDIEVHNKHMGQFFTPDCLSRLCVELTLTKEHLQECIERDGIYRIHEPACGSGSMILNTADIARRFGFEPSQHLFVHAADLDARCVHMCFVQLSLLGIPCVVQRMNSLSLEVYDSFTNIEGYQHAQEKRDTDTTQAAAV